MVCINASDHPDYESEGIQGTVPVQEDPTYCPLIRMVSRIVGMIPKVHHPVPGTDKPWAKGHTPGYDIPTPVIKR
jgi:hypothetical protein